MGETPDPVNKAIWRAAAAASHLSDALPQILRSLCTWASDVLEKPVDVQPIGSVVTGITDTSSDIDVVLLPGEPDAEHVLERLNSAADTLPAFQVLRFVPSARAPVLTLARADGITLDLTASNYLPVYNSALLKEYCDLDARLRPLACAVKRFAKAANVVGVVSNNLSSYAWSLLAVFYLQTADLKLYLPETAECRKLVCLQSFSKGQEVKLQGRSFRIGFKRLADMTPAEQAQFSFRADETFPWRALVRGFFKFYSEDVDIHGALVSVRCGKALTHIKDGGGRGPHIEDPFDPEHQLGSVLSDTRREAFVEALRWGETMLEDGSFAELLEGHADLRSPVVWDTLLHSDELVHHRVRPQGSRTDAEPVYSDCPVSEDVVALLGHGLDAFQRRAIYCAAQGESVIVAAPTSAGKTAVAEAAMMQVLHEGRSAIFCSPSKALSNQKFVDFRRKFPKVGLLTGDVSIAPASPILVATTEVLPLGSSWACSCMSSVWRETILVHSGPPFVVWVGNVGIEALSSGCAPPKTSKSPNQGKADTCETPSSLSFS